MSAPRLGWERSVDSRCHLDLRALAFYIDRVEVGDEMANSLFSQGQKTLLIALFIPSVERDGTTRVDQNKWVEAALEIFGRLFGGATAYPKAIGVWRDDERGGALIKDEPIVIHCYMTPNDIQDPENQKALGAFCRRLGRETNQGEIGLVVGDEYFAIRDFS